MSVHGRKDRKGKTVRWREGTKQRSRHFDRKKDADAFETEVRRRKQLGGLEYLDAGTETLGSYVAETWGPTHVAALAPKTIETYTSLYDLHIDPHLGETPLRSLTPDAIGRWRNRLATTEGVDVAERCRTLLGAILQRAFESGRIVANPQRRVRALPKVRADEVRPLAPDTVERLRVAVVRLARKGRADDRFARARDAVLISLLAYAGLRPQEVRGLVWRCVRENTLLVWAPKTKTWRTVRLLAPLRHDLIAWRLVCGQPSDATPIIPAADGSIWTEVGYEQWRGGIWAQTLVAAGLDYQRPYDLRHSFASLLLHEGRSAVYVARQLGNSPAVTLRTYVHAIDELEGSPRIDAETAIREARSRLVFPVRSPEAAAGGSPTGSAA